MSAKPFPPEAKRYVRRIGIAAAIYVSPLLAKIVLPDVLVGHPLVQFLLLALPITGMLGFFYAMQRLVDELSDEYLRHIMVKVYQLATWLVLSITAVVGFLQIDKFVNLVSLVVVPILWFACFGIASVWVRWREGRLDSSE
jgi:hypothetical protein